MTLIGHRRAGFSPAGMAVLLAVLIGLAVTATAAQGWRLTKHARFEPRLTAVLDQFGSTGGSLPTRFHASRVGPSRRLGLRASLSATFSSIEPYAPPSVPVGAFPSGIAVNAATRTVYVVNQGDDTVSVIDARRCNAGNPAGCSRPLATITLGTAGPPNGGPISAILSPDGRTLYVTSVNGSNAVGVINAANCNASDTVGCAKGPLATVATGNGPLGLAEDPVSRTLYVANIGDNTVSVIDGTHCNAQHTAGCSAIAPTVGVGNAPVAVADDPTVHSVYVANAADNTVSVIDTSACNATNNSGCSAVPAVQAVGGAPDALAVSSDGNTVYVANSGNGPNGIEGGGSTVSVIGATACNGGHPQGCSLVPAPVAGVGSGTDDQPQALAVDAGTHNLYAANSQDDSVSVIDTRTCSARALSGCPHPARDVQSGGGPSALAALPSEHTVYVVDGNDGAVAVIADGACTSKRLAGCRPAAVPAALMGSYNVLISGSADDSADHTVYEADYGPGFSGPGVLDLINTRTCNAKTSAGCTTPPPSFTPNSNPNVAAIDPASDTLYVSEGGPGPNQLEVIAAGRCNATYTTGCGSSSIVPLGTDDAEGVVTIDDATHTAYVSGFSAIAVIDTSHCNATDMTGCSSQPVGKISIGQPTFSSAIAPDTLYATAVPGFDLGAPGFVDVIDTRHCRAADTSQCSTLTPATVNVGVGPSATVFDSAHHTLYIPDNADGDSASTLAMIDTRHCKGDDTSRCAALTPATAPAGRSALAAGLDRSTGTLYVTNFSDASVFRYDTATCNTGTQTGCRKRPPEVITGSGPDNVALDPGSDTVYVPNFFDGTVSLISAGP